jgi:hypothetical protein
MGVLRKVVIDYRGCVLFQMIPNMSCRIDSRHLSHGKRIAIKMHNILEKLDDIHRDAV